MAKSEQEIASDPKRIITDWLVNKQISKGRRLGGSTTNTGRVAQGFAFNSAPLEDQYTPPARRFPGNSTHAARLGVSPPAFEQGNIGPLAGGRFSSGVEKWPAPKHTTSKFVGEPNYWARGPIPSADTGRRWSNSLANSFASAGNLILNPVLHLGASVAPYSDYLDATSTITRGLPGRGLMISPLAMAISKWSKNSNKTAQHLVMPSRRLPSR